MKFSDIQENDWAGLAPYIDTCLLPVTGLDGLELPWEATAALERLRDALDALEIPFRGRVVTYPALHYLQGGQGQAQVAELEPGGHRGGEGTIAGANVSATCASLKRAGFRFVIVVTISPDLWAEDVPAADLVISCTGEYAEKPKQYRVYVREQVEQLWRTTVHEWK